MKTVAFEGVWPVMLTPFTKNNTIDWASLERLINWYIDAGVHGLFAACQSSEMFFLSDEETEQLTRFVVEMAAGRVPVVASGHTGVSLKHQAAQIKTIASCGVDAVILISNRLASEEESGEQALSNLKALCDAIGADTKLGIYECPYPYKRLLDEGTIRFCAESGRFVFIKDTCCDIDLIKKRLEIVEGTCLKIANANSQTLYETYKAGGLAFSGIMANFHPELYVWLHNNWDKDPDGAQKVSDFLSVAACTEAFGYPVSAKAFHKSEGRFCEVSTRSSPFMHYEKGFFPAQIDSMQRMAKALMSELGIGT